MSLSMGVMLSALRSTRPEDLSANARHAEDLGLDALFTGDHLVASVPVLDSTLTLAAAAAVRGAVDPDGNVWSVQQISSRG